MRSPGPIGINDNATARLASYSSASTSAMPYLTRIAYKPERVPSGDDIQSFPYSVPTIRTLPALDVDAPVTFFVGENGSGKSTLLEAISAAADLRSRQRSHLGAEDVEYDASLEEQRKLGARLRLSWSPRTRDGFFMRAEDFFGYLKSEARTTARVLREKAETFKEVTRYTSAEGDSVHRDEVEARKFMAQLDARSHGESFMDLFESRVRKTGIYLLDEPEGPLSPKRQIALLDLMMKKASDGAQFIIATHSPVLLAFPGAKIYSFDEAPIREARYDDLEHVTVLRAFLSDPEAYLNGRR
jgi:predicted ATPase